MQAIKNSANTLGGIDTNLDYTLAKLDEIAMAGIAKTFYTNCEHA